MRLAPERLWPGISPRGLHAGPCAKDLEEVVEDTKEEMEKYGALTRLEVLRPPTGSPEDMPVYLIVRFTDQESADKVRPHEAGPRRCLARSSPMSIFTTSLARNTPASQAFLALQGRTFDGRIVHVRYITVEEFEQRAG